MFKGRKIIALCLTRLSNDETTAKVAELNKALVAKDYRLFALIFIATTGSKTLRKRSIP